MLGYLGSGCICSKVLIITFEECLARSAYAALSRSSASLPQPRSDARDIASLTARGSSSTASNSAINPHASGSSALHTVASFLQNARGRAVTAAVRSMAYKPLTRRGNIPMQLNISPASSACTKARRFRFVSGAHTTISATRPAKHHAASL